jgi:hypothetical protein
MPFDQADGYAGPLVQIRNPNPSPPATESRLHLGDCRSFWPGSPFRSLVRETARRVGVQPHALLVRVLLHLPRVASQEGWVTRQQVQRELRISAQGLHADIRAVGSQVSPREFRLRDLIFEEIEPSRALPFLESLHYLRSARQGSLYFAFVDPVDRFPITLCSLSTLEWKRVANEISEHFEISQRRVCEVSRVYSVDTAPRNAISSLLSNVRNHLRRSGHPADLLVTAVDPNLGFTGSSYRAANWQHWMSVRARPYIYENGRYVTPRQLRERFGISRLVELQAKYPGRFQQSRAPLLDTMIFCGSVNGETRVVPAPERRRLRR